MGLEQYIHPGRLERQAGPGGVAALPSGEGRGETEHPCCPSASSSDFPPRLPRRGPPGAALTREDPAVPGEKSGPHGEAAVGAVGGLLGLLAGQQQPLDVLGLQGEAGTLLGHVDPPGPAEKRNASSQPVWAGPHRDGSSSPGVCPCREAARCAPLGVLGRAGEGEGWGQKVCVCVLVPAWMPRVHGCFMRSRGDHSHCWHALMSQRVGTDATVSDVTVDTVASGKRPWSGQLVVWEIQAPSVDQPVC